MTIQLGARWDADLQNARFSKAREDGLLDYAEVNYPIAPTDDPSAFGLPILAHTSNNPLCSAYGIDYAVAGQVKQGLAAASFPWVGEHLAWLNCHPSGSLGYVVSPLFTEDFKHVAVSNIKALQQYYNLRLALELGPVYGKSGEYESEMHFLGDVADAADTHIILDVTHWQISNRNLQRPDNYGLEALDLGRVVELHIAGMRSSENGRYWHDAHGNLPSEDLFETVENLLGKLSNLKAITFEHHMDSPEADFYAALKRLKSILN